MRLKSISSTFVTTGSLLFIFALGAANASAAVPAPIPAATCSNATLSGRYAHLIQGAYGPGTQEGSQTFGIATPFQGVQTLVFDGQGTLTGSESFVAGGYEITNPTGTHFVPVVGTYTINSDCSGTGYICSNHMTGGLTGGPNTCTGKTVGTSGLLWEDFVAVTIVLADGGKSFHMLVIPPYDSNGIIRTISSTGTKMDAANVEPSN